MSEKSVILIVDDNSANLRVLSESLITGGFEVAVATNGESALKQMQHNPPDLVLLDVQMPGIDGFETCRRIKENPATQNIPVIFMTALVETESKVKGLSVGGVDYITKPFQHEEVLARVKVHLQICQLTKKLEVQNTLLQQFNETLEHRVEERTIELQKAQLQVIQQEKLSSLGQLVAGVAHEINNPIGFIYSNFSHAQKYTQELLELVRFYREDYPVPSARIDHHIQAIDLEFLSNDLPRLLNSMLIGADRIREIVVSLRSFSRHDEAECKDVDIHEGIDNTLLILHHRTKEKNDRPAIKITKNYGQLPLVQCFPGQLNQVFMNLIANAVDALEEAIDMQAKPDDYCPEVTIQTEVYNYHFVKITISDNGSGIPATIQHKIFDPFFTTKPIGKGTGLGLAISHQIVIERHRGQFFCHSSAETGTEFTIIIPIEQPDKEMLARSEVAAFG